MPFAHHHVSQYALPQTTKSTTLKRILLIQLRQLGDILLTTPAIGAVRRAYPEAEIDFLSHKMGQLVLADNPHIDQLHTYHERDSILDSLRLYKSLRKRRYDLVVDFMFAPRSALMTWISGAPTRLSFDSKRRWAYSKTIDRPKASRYIVQEKFDLLESLGIPCESQRIVFPWALSDLKPFEQFCKDHQTFEASKCRVVLSVTHRRSQRRWPLQRYAAISDMLQEKWGAQVVWIWGPGETDFVKEAMQYCRLPALLAPKTSMRELAAFIANCDLFIGNSNGPSHVATSTEIPSLQLHGPTYAKSWSPLNERHQAVQKAQMEDIDIESVWHALGQLRPVVEKRVQYRLQNGVRIEWSDPMAF